MMLAAGLLSTHDVLDRYGISERSLFRRINSPVMNFPEPVKVNGRLTWHEPDLAAWERRQEARQLMPVSGVIVAYDEFVEAMRARRDALGLTCDALDDRSGMQDGYSNKLENYGRGVGPVTLCGFR